MLNKFNIFASSSYARAVMPENAGLFLCPQDTRHYPYRGVPKGSQSPCIGLDTVKGNAVFYYLLFKELQMSKTMQRASAQRPAYAKSGYSEKLKDPRWQKRRLSIMERDRFACRLCGDTTIPLNVHHKKYINGCNPWEYPEDELITLCECCHKFIENIKDIHGLNVYTEIKGKCLKSKNPKLRIRLYNYLDLSQIYVFNRDNAVIKVVNNFK